MLNPSSPAQKTLSEEDSSGSDVGSEVGLEHETDRFGFILTNGSTASVRSAGPPPELVRQREAKWIHIIGQWDRILLKKTSKVKMQCQKGIPASLRAKCWPLLCGATDRMKQNKDLYKSLDSQPALQSWVDVIERDLDRQFPFHEMFLSKDGHGQRGLFRVLKAYTQFQPEEGYCQAQGPVAAVLLMNMPAEEAFWCLVQISEQYLPGYYSPLLEGVLFDAAMLTWVLKRTCPSAHKHLQHFGVEPLMFATDWLMCLFTRHLPFNTLLRVWDLFFCYGVRVLLQVAVVLVRRVLGRAEQRKQCQGQMETLERLRSIRDEVQEEDDAFIAEVCSVPLSTRDLQRQTEKELEKWRKDKPSSTFDPRGRCQGYQMAWTKARQTKEEWERKEREKGNLSVPLARSASTLSLSPSLLHKRWRKGGKANAGEWEGGSKVVRHLSMRAKEDWQSWTDLNFRKVQGVKEEDDVVFEEQKKQSKPELKQTEQKECIEGSKSQSITTQKTETIVDLKREVEAREPEQQEGQPTGEDNLQPVGVENSPVETDTTHSPAEEQSCNKQEEELDSDSQSQIPKELSQKTEEQETEVCDIKEETETHESECTGVVEENQTEITTNAETEMQVSVETSEEPIEQMDKKPEERTETENVQKQVDTVVDVTTETEPQVITEASPDSESDAEALADKNTDDTADAVTHQEGTETENSFEVKYQSTESLTELQVKEEPHTQTGTETDVLAQIQVENAATLDESETEIDLQQHSVIPLEDMTAEAETIETSDDCIQQEESADVAENDTEVIGTDKTVTESNDTSEPPQPKEDICLTVHSMAEVENDVSICDQNETEEAPVESQIANATVAPPHNKETSTKPATPILTSEPDGKIAQIGTCDESVSETTKVQEDLEEQRKGDIQEEDDDYISTLNTPQLVENLHTDNNPQVQNKEESDLVKEEIQNCGRRSSRSSGDFCLRKSASSRESRLARKLSEDLFTTPQKTNQPVLNPPDKVKLAELKGNPGDVNATQSPSSVIRSTESLSKSEHDDPPSLLAEINEEKQPQTPPKRFGLFRRLRGDQPKKTKTKATPKMQVPKILIQDFSDEVGIGKPAEVEEEEKLSSKERRRRRRERERQEKEEERLRKKKEKELEKEKERDRRKPQTRGKSFQVQTEKGRTQLAANTGSQTLRYSASFAESYF
ncbi:ecotropic viral integration site 5 ortholog [Sphaeramia orbicularis]|uniref:Ecotropic viral integration site 5 ortholog-like n=1 Tax=Sphaeramia orbicularis TaxID=375764 RepID=A0A673A5E9_9TELE|nr:ecotropic viral integration site 5 ortholog-like [Sphaeramia orbicularis]